MVKTIVLRDTSKTMVNGDMDKTIVNGDMIRVKRLLMARWIKQLLMAI